MNAARHDARQAGRELALAVMCHLESYPAGEQAAAVATFFDAPPFGDADGEDLIARFAQDPPTRAFAEELVAQCLAQQVEIDALVEATSRSWRLSRMDRVDRNVVRMATAELMQRAETPRGAILSEAVRLAGRYGSERSAAFVNGLVEDLAKRVRPDPGAPA